MHFLAIFSVVILPSTTADRALRGSTDSSQRFTRRIWRSSKSKSKSKSSSSSERKGCRHPRGCGKRSETEDDKERFNIKLVNVGENTDYDDIFAEAAARWEKLIVADVPDIPARNVPGFDWFGGFFGSDITYDEPIDDVVIGYAFRDESFFSSNRTLGSARAVYLRNYDFSRWAPPMTAVSGAMQFNKNAIARYNYTENDLKLIILHEMGHVLGIGGSYWYFNCASDCFKSIEADGSFTLGDDSYRCVKAQEQYYSLGLVPTYQGAHLTVNHMGGLGNVCGHWSESSFNVYGVSSELMTPFFETGIAQPLSTVSLGALEDIGYKVDYSSADSFPSEALVGGRRRAQASAHPSLVPDHDFDLSQLMDHEDNERPLFVAINPWD